MLPELSAAGVAEKIVPMILPFLPYLLKGAEAAGTKFVEALGERSAKIAVDMAEKIWGKLKPKVDTSPAAKEIAQEAADDPTRSYLPGALVYQFKNLLEDENLRKEIEDIIAAGEREGATLESFIHAGKIYGEVTGVKVINLDALEKAGLIKSKIEVDVVGKNGIVKGVEFP